MYIASSENRLYVAAEPGYGVIGEELYRIPAVRLSVQNKAETPTRRDKTGTRTFLGAPGGVRRTTAYELRTYMTSWVDQDAPPCYAPLIEAACGGTAAIHGGGALTDASTTTALHFAQAHGLSSGQAVAVEGEIRFVTSVASDTVVNVNAPFSAAPTSDSAATPTVTFQLAKSLKSASIFDFWSPTSAVQRVVSGVGVDEFSINVNADYHEFLFSGPAADVLDSQTFEDGQGGTESFPAEPEDAAFDLAVIPGHIGQVWLGAASERFYTLTSAKVRLRNRIDVRNKEFGSPTIRGLVGGQREVSVDFEMFAGDDDQTRSLYEAARQGSAIRAMFQLGEQQGQLFGVYMKGLVPSVPDFSDDETRLMWRFNGCRAQGTGEDELVVAFG